MPFDTFVMKAVTAELQDLLTGAAVQRIYEPVQGQFVISLYSPGGQKDLLLSIDARHARVHLSAGRRRGGGEQPSPFCMLLRKYLIGGRAASFSNPPFERILEIAFDPPEGLPPVKLIAEIMGRRSNIILVDGQGTILGAARTATRARNPLRPILPGEEYKPVPAQDKLKPLEMSRDQFARALEKELAGGRELREALIGAVQGISPLAARELLYRSGGANGSQPGSEDLYEHIVELFSSAEAGRFRPGTLPRQGIYAAIALRHQAGEEWVEYASINEMLDLFYTRLTAAEKEKTLRESLIRAAGKGLSGLEKKRKEQEKELAAAEDAPRYRLFGELLLAYGNTVARGVESTLLPDLYNPGVMITVPLNPAKSAAANAQHYFKRYRRAKNSRDKIKKQLQKTTVELRYLSELLYSIEEADSEGLEEIREEMIEGGYRREKRKSKPAVKNLPRPLTFKTSAGHTALVGRNNRQNDYITFQAAVRRDTWFHVRRVPGSHVVLKEAPSPPPPADIEEAAFLAAYFSKGRQSSAVEVDYTAIGHVRRRPGGKPGFVFYENYKTITVNPLDPGLRAHFGLEQES